MSKSTPHSAIDPSAQELSAEDLALLGRVRRDLQEERVPSLVRQRLLDRVLAEAGDVGQGPIAPAAQLVPVQGGVLGSAPWWIAAAALVLVLVANAPGWFGASAEPPSVAVDSRSTAPGALGEGLLRMSIFRAPAQVLPGSGMGSDTLPPAALSLFGEQPFSAGSRAWQVRRWDDLRSEPVEPAVHDFKDGALCVAVGSGQRVLGGWPWLGREGSVSRPSAPRAPAPEAVALVAGKSYRLGFKAWAREPLPAQLLIALGHASLPFSGRAGARVPVSTAPQPFVVDFVSSADDPSVGIAFLATGADAEEPSRVCLSDVTLTER